MYWAIFALCLGLVAGASVGYRHVKNTASLIKFVPKRDEEEILRQMHIQLGKDTICFICGERITRDNLGAILRTKSRNIFFCSKSQCMTIASISPSKKENVITGRTS